MITTILFDWGGVLTKGKYTAGIIKILEEKYQINVEEKYSVVDEWFRILNFGKVKLKEFVEQFKQIGIIISEKEMMDVLEQAINPYHEVVEIVKKLKAKYRLIMLSNNTDPVVEVLKLKHKKLLDLFEKKYFSSELYMSKPDPKIFEYIIKDAKLNVSKCVFIDDKEKNTRIAENFGIKSITFKDHNQLEKEFEKLGIDF